MARTIYGNLTGQAARTERLDALIELPSKFALEYDAAMAELKLLDPAWEKWYDDRPEQTCGEMLPLIKERVRILKGEA